MQILVLILLHYNKDESHAKKKKEIKYPIHDLQEFIGTKKEICNCFYTVYNNFALNSKYEILKKKSKTKVRHKNAFYIKIELKKWREVRNGWG